MASIDEAKEIIKSTPISSIISYYHPISKKGGNYEGICPFHGDSHPSLKINDSKGIYKCFACGAAGDSIKFVQDKLNVDFVQAIKEIAENIGISIEETKLKNKNPKFDMALRVLQVASKLYKKIANENDPKPFKEFLTKRGLNEDSTTDFQIGYAPGNNALTKYLNSIQGPDKDMAISVAKDIGLIRDNKRGAGHYDFYRDRVMFPIWDHSAKVRGFSSRAVLPEQVPKYLNSGESFIFDKGNILYGFNLAKNIIREQDNVIVAEGNMDVIALHQYGFKNSVATMGVALSQNSVRLLSNMTKNIFLAMDSDNAGIKAMTRINTDFIKLDIIPKFIDFTPAKDPDEFLNEFGRLELQKRIEDAPTFLDYLIKEEIPESIPEKTDSKLEILRNIFKILSPMGSNLMANEKVILAAKSLGLKSSNEDILAEYKGYLTKLAPAPKSTFKKQATAIPSQKAGPQNQTGQNQEPNFQNDNYQGPPPQDEPWNMNDSYNFESHGIPAYIDDNTVHIPTNKIAKSEKILLEALLSHPELILAHQITEILDKIEHFEVKRIVQWLKKIYLEIDEAEYSLFVQEKMKESLPDGIKEIMASSLFNYTNLKLDQKVIDKMVTDLNKRLDEGLLRNERDALREKQLNVISDEEGLEVVNEIQQIELKLLALRNK